MVTRESGGLTGRLDCGMVLDMASGVGKPEQLIKMKHCFELDEPCARSQDI